MKMSGLRFEHCLTYGRWETCERGIHQKELPDKIIWVTVRASVFGPARINTKGKRHSGRSRSEAACHRRSLNALRFRRYYCTNTSTISMKMPHFRTDTWRKSSMSAKAAATNICTGSGARPSTVSCGDRSRIHGVHFSQTGHCSLHARRLCDIHFEGVNRRLVLPLIFEFRMIHHRCKEADDGVSKDLDCRRRHAAWCWLGQRNHGTARLPAQQTEQTPGH